MIASEDPALPSTRRDGIPIELERTVLRCLEKDPDGRATLVELARTLARYAPDRARASLERVEAATGALPEPRPRAPTYAERARQDSILHNTRMRLGEGAAAGDRGERTMSSWGHDRRGMRGGSGVILLLLVASGLVAVAVSTGRVGVMKLSKDIGGAASAVSSAAGAAVSAGASAVSAGASAVAAEASAVASTLPPMAPLPPLPLPDEPAASASASSEPDQGDPGNDEPDEPVASAAPGTRPPGTGPPSIGPVVPQPHSGARKVTPKPAPHHGKTHKHHYR
jgi:hypothetical protein